MEKLRREKAAERCPTCGAALVAVERSGKTTHECPACRRPAR
jgi:Zn-finger nucleic acid-binding protein